MNNPLRDQGGPKPRVRRQMLWPVVLTAIVTWESVSAVPGVGPAWLSLDKLAHFGVFGLLATAIVRLDEVKRWPWFGAGWAIMLVSVYGAGTEFLQSLTPYRSMEFDDWVADTLGAAVAVILYLRWTGYRRLLEQPVRRRRPGGYRSGPGKPQAWSGDALVADENSSRPRDGGVASPTGPDL
ncbi:MAG: VanZ family protein [Opitutaceae bacterium]|nr:VanZ family protein [Opitutaceae bacterium]